LNFIIDILTVFGLPNVAIFSTNVEAESQFMFTTKLSAEHLTATFAKPLSGV
jgi:hypothetical protein